MIEAMDVMRRLPDGTRRLLRALDGERWPDSAVKESPENSPLPFDAGAIRPGGAQLDAADEAIGWLLWLDERTRMIVSGRAASSCLRSRYFEEPQNNCGATAQWMRDFGVQRHGFFFCFCF